MKVFILGILLVCLYCIEGAVVKREAQEEQVAPTVPSILSQYFPGFMESLTEYTTQTQAFFQKMKEGMATDQMADRVTQAFNSILESAKNAMQ